MCCACFIYIYIYIRSHFGSSSACSFRARASSLLGHYGRFALLADLKMGRKTLAVVQRGAETIRILDAAALDRHLCAAPRARDDEDSDIARLAKYALGRLEKVNGVASMGIGKALKPLRPRVAKKDRFMLGRLRGLGEAAGFVRHLTEVGYEQWVKDFDAVIERLLAPKKDDTPGKGKGKSDAAAALGAVATNAEVMDVDGAGASAQPFKAPRRRRRRAKVAAAGVTAATLPDSLAVGDRSDELPLDSWADELPAGSSVQSIACALENALVQKGADPKASQELHPSELLALAPIRVLSRGPSDEQNLPPAKTPRHLPSAGREQRQAVAAVRKAAAERERLASEASVLPPLFD